jgi:hypothetical protein
MVKAQLGEMLQIYMAKRKEHEDAQEFIRAKNVIDKDKNRKFRKVNITLSLKPEENNL